MDKQVDSDAEKDGIWKDPRFSHLVNDPRFRQLPKAAPKVKIDKRFQSMFKDDKFRVKYSVDKYGRKVNKSSTEDLQKYYKLDGSSDEEQEEKEIRKEEEAIAKDENDELDAEREVLSSNIIKKLRESDVDYARGEGRLLTDSSSDEESSENDDDEIFIEHVWGELDRDAPRTNESTRRLAACNMDWDRIRAADIMVMCSSFLPRGRSILSVKIYPSEYGKQRMAEEEVHGPPELTKDTEKDDSDEDSSDEELVKEVDSDAEEGDEYHMEKLRQYQLNRLKYYYAVIEFDSVSTADKIYAECDGLEYESTATKLDLRFIPDDTTFDEEPKDVCTEMPDLTKYKPRLFTTTALQQAKVELTWDETNVERKEIGEKLRSGKLAEINAADLRQIVAYSSEEDSGEETQENDASGDQSSEDSEKDPIDKYKSLLKEINKVESEKAKKKYEMEYTWGINNNGLSSKEKESKTKALTPIEKALLKKSEKNKRRKEERKKKKFGNADEDACSSDDVPSDIDLNDPYFAEEFANGDFEDPVKKKKDKLKKSKSKQVNDEKDEEKAKELELLLDDGEDDKHHFSLKKIQDAENETKSKKRRKKLKKSRQEIEANRAKVDDNFEVDLNDSRFNAVFTSHLFNIDPTDPHYKKTKGMEAIIQEKFKRRSEKAPAGQDHDRNGNNSEDIPDTKRPRKMLENKLLIKNIKKKLSGNLNKS